ncbi:hypothetical protein B0H14DRAFT_2402595, partial [Mycena olivaceomarginata]
PNELTGGEAFWHDHHEWLEESGYLLRPRFRPGWTRSWHHDPRIWRFSCEDVWLLKVSKRLIGVNWLRFL